MAQIGTPLTSTIPAVNSPGPDYATGINDVLTELKEAVEGTVPYNVLSGSVLNLNNVPIDNAEYIRFYDSGVVPSSTIDARIVYAAGEFWFVNATGAIQITSGAGLNAASLGGIAGDYGGANPASVRFVDSATRYDFYDDFSTLTWGYARSRGIDISAGAVSSFYCQVRFAGAASYTLTLPPAKPSSGRSVVVMDDTGELFFNDSTNTVENDIKLAGAARVREVGLKKVYSFNHYSDLLIGTGASWTASVDTNVNKGVVITVKGTGGGVTKQVDGLVTGTTITAVTVRTNKTSTGTAAAALFKVRDGVATVVGLVGGTSTSSGWTNLSLTGTYVVEAGCSYHVKVTVGDDNDIIESVEFTYNG